MLTMFNRLHAFRWGLAIALTLGLSGTGLAQQGSQNRVPDADFAQTAEVVNQAGDEARQHSPEMPWKWYPIEGSASVTFAAGHAEATGGKVFLHSDYFDVEPGQTYEIHLTAEGDGRISTGLLWWTESDRGTRGWAEPHWTQMDDPVASSSEPSEVRATFEAPENAAQAYVRLVVTDGTVTIRDVSVTPTSE